MKVVCRERLVNKVLDEMMKHEAKGLEVDYILVTGDEFDQLRAELPELRGLGPCGLQMDCRDFPAPLSGPFQETYRTRSACLLFGRKLYVVPQRFHPK